MRGQMVCPPHQQGLSAFVIKDDWRQPVSVIEPIYSSSKGRRAGVSREDLATALQTVYSGKSVGVYRDGDDLVPIISRAPERVRVCCRAVAVC